MTVQKNDAKSIRQPTGGTRGAEFRKEGSANIIPE
eukprot:CAMPEP_0184348010 /NCGR_PEP_ID=MMETSP1089-20130417/23351_1 /TAXON_ID=38269 ORGANISM="Gloeochaete wittrockiana, Strain SAG46.84" /NCGR_SAMPLE_ID=MMETSP1089 /ASSEMBLY_ACC=CAM_ASM_000445 /LENGTH=34 /DNA_ID= /DNA_START= /DNA_END= /DNA_ORIENTATION=